jgi:hypothetical protein
MPAPREILDLVARFEQQLDAYKSGQYNETQLRREFLDPFFKALGWDVDNTSGYAEAYKDVVHEDAIRIGDRAKAPDYCFRIGGTRKSFVEAKKPSVDIKEEVPPAYQVRSCAWSAKLPLSILSDFEEFAFYEAAWPDDVFSSAIHAPLTFAWLNGEHQPFSSHSRILGEEHKYTQPENLVRCGDSGSFRHPTAFQLRSGLTR